MLQRVLDSFFQQNDLDLLNYELIIVDNNSSDNTKTVAENFMHFQNVRYVFEAKQGVSAARNRGVFESRGGKVAFLDDDVLVDRNWLKNLERCFRQTGADVVGGRSYLILAEDPPGWLGPELRMRLSEVDLGDYRRNVSCATSLFGLNLAIRKTVFGLEGGFNESLGRIGFELTTGEETAFLHKVMEEGRIIVYDPDVVVQHIIEPARLKWNYFKGLAAGAGRSKEQNESPRNRPYQFLRVCMAIGFWGRSVFVSAKVHLLNGSQYEKKCANFDVIASKAYFLHRLRRLWR